MSSLHVFLLFRSHGSKGKPPAQAGASPSPSTPRLSPTCAVSPSPDDTPPELQTTAAVEMESEVLIFLCCPWTLDEGRSVCVCVCVCVCAFCGKGGRYSPSSAQRWQGQWSYQGIEHGAKGGEGLVRATDIFL